MAAQEVIGSICLVFLIPDLILAVWAYYDCINRGVADKSALKVALFFLIIWVIVLKVRILVMISTKI